MSDALVILAGGTGDLGGRIAAALGRRGIAFRALVRPGTPASVRARLESAGGTVLPVAHDDVAALTRACAGGSCLVSAVNGLEPVIIGLQGRLLDAAVAAGVRHFIPSDYSLDFTRTRPSDNRNLDLRRSFMAHIDRVQAAGAAIRSTSVLNGAFADLLTGQAPLILHKRRRVLYWGSADQPLDFTTRDDVAEYVAEVSVDASAPRILRIAGSTVSPRQLAGIMTELSGERFGLWRAGGIGLLSVLIRIARGVTPRSEAVFPAWQGMQYLRDMASGRGRLQPLDNDRYGVRTWSTVRDVLR